jgi:hypothetical protein
MTQTLRVLNAARFYEIGLPLTYDQSVHALATSPPSELWLIATFSSPSLLSQNRYQAHPPSHLIARLTSRSQHLLSLRISSYLHLSPAPVLKHWAQAKIASAKGSTSNEDQVCRAIVDKLAQQADVSCADVAQTAWTTGQTSLATKLLEHEVRASKQVPLLLSMKEDDLALVKAIESGDPNLGEFHSTHFSFFFVNRLCGQGIDGACELDSLHGPAAP